MNRGFALAGIALTGVVSVGVALYTQHALNMQPCPWCVLQRLIMLVMAATALLGLLAHGLRLITLRGALAGLTALVATSGAAAALWQHFVAAQSSSCAMTWADRIMGATGLDSRWPEVFAAYASCADAKVKLLGLPYEFYSLALFIVVMVVAAMVMRSLRR